MFTLDNGSYRDHGGSAVFALVFIYFLFLIPLGTAYSQSAPPTTSSTLPILQNEWVETSLSGLGEYAGDTAWDLVQLRRNQTEQILDYASMGWVDFHSSLPDFTDALQGYTRRTQRIIPSVDWTVGFQDGEAGVELLGRILMWSFGRGVLPAWLAAELALLPAFFDEENEPIRIPDSFTELAEVSGLSPGAINWLSNFHQNGEKLLSVGEELLQVFLGHSQGSVVPVVSAPKGAQLVESAHKLLSFMGYPSGGILLWYYSMPLLKAMESPLMTEMTLQSPWLGIRLKFWRQRVFSGMYRQALSAMRDGLSELFISQDTRWVDPDRSEISLQVQDWELLKRDQVDKYRGLVKRDGRLGTESQLHWRIVPALFTRYAVKSLLEQGARPEFYRSNRGMVLEPEAPVLLLESSEEGYSTYAGYFEGLLLRAGLPGGAQEGQGGGRIYAFRWIQGLSREGAVFLSGSTSDQLSFFLNLNNLCFPGQETLQVGEAANTGAQMGILLGLPAALELAAELGVQNARQITARGVSEVGVENDGENPVGYLPSGVVDRSGDEVDPQDSALTGETLRMRDGESDLEASALIEAEKLISGHGYAALWAQFGPLLMNRNDGGDRINLIDRLLMGLLLNLSSEGSRLNSLPMEVVRAVELSKWVLRQLQWYVISPQQALTALAHVWSVKASIPEILERVYSSLYQVELGSGNEQIPVGLPPEFWTWQFVRLEPNTRDLIFSGEES